MRWLLQSVLFFCGIACGLLGVAYYQAEEIYHYSDSFDGVNLPEVDAIVVLAGGRGRMVAATDFWVRFYELGDRPSPKLFLSGLGERTTFGAWSAQIRPEILKILPREDVILETESKNTDENIAFLFLRAKREGWQSILLVTSRYHMRRALSICKRYLDLSGLQIRIESSSVIQEPFEPDEWRTSVHGIRVTLTEYLKWLYHRYLWEPNATVVSQLKEPVSVR